MLRQLRCSMYGLGYDGSFSVEFFTHAWAIVLTVSIAGCAASVLGLNVFCHCTRRITNSSKDELQPCLVMTTKTTKRVT